MAFIRVIVLFLHCFHWNNIYMINHFELIIRTNNNSHLMGKTVFILYISVTCIAYNKNVALYDCIFSHELPAPSTLHNTSTDWTRNEQLTQVRKLRDWPESLNVNKTEKLCKNWDELGQHCCIFWSSLQIHRKIQAGTAEAINEKMQRDHEFQ